MIIPSNYSINVAMYHGMDWQENTVWSHFCTIELGECSKAEALSKFAIIKEKFDLAFICTLQHVECCKMDITS